MKKIPHATDSDNEIRLQYLTVDRFLTTHSIYACIRLSPRQALSSMNLKDLRFNVTSNIIRSNLFWGCN